VGPGKPSGGGSLFLLGGSPFVFLGGGKPPPNTRGPKTFRLGPHLVGGFDFRGTWVGWGFKKGFGGGVGGGYWGGGGKMGFCLGPPPQSGGQGFWGVVFWGLVCFFFGCFVCFSQNVGAPPTIFFVFFFFVFFPLRRLFSIPATLGGCSLHLLSGLLVHSSLACWPSVPLIAL